MDYFLITTILVSIAAIFGFLNGKFLKLPIAGLSNNKYPFRAIPF